MAKVTNKKEWTLKMDKSVFEDLSSWTVESAPYWKGGSGALWSPTTTTATISIGSTASIPGGVAVGSGWSGGWTPLSGTWASSGTFTVSWDEFDTLTPEQQQMVRDLICDEVLARA